MTNENADTTSEQTVDWEARALKAENKIVSMKQEAKAAESKKEEEDIVVKEEAPKEDLKEEPKDEAETKETTKAEEAPQEEPVIQEVTQVTNMMAVPWTEVLDKAPSVYAISDLEKMSIADYNKAKDAIDAGTATVDRNS